MMEISPLTGSDRDGWKVLARGFNALLEAEISDDGYEQTWRRLLDGKQIRGIAARLDGKVVGFAHYIFGASVWSDGDYYLQDLFVDQENRGRGVSRALVDWLERDAEEHYAAKLYWHTSQDKATTLALYD